MADNDPQPTAGQTITPDNQAPASVPEATAQAAEQTPAAPEAATATAPAPRQAPQSAPQTVGGSETAPAPAADDGGSISWTASEFIAHDKAFGWYAALLLAAVLFAGLVYLVSRDVVSVAVVLIAALMFGIYAGHKPRQIQYRLDADGLTVGEKRFRYGDFRSFAVMDEGAFSSIVFMPLKRFATSTTIYYPPEEEEAIVGALSDLLPMEERDHDAIDRLMHRIRY